VLARYQTFQYIKKMNAQSMFSILATVFAVCFLILSVGGRAIADSPQTKSMDSMYEALSERVEKADRKN
jgi:hypothetical protein